MPSQDMTPEQHSTNTSDQRGSKRREGRGIVRVFLDDRPLLGSVSNVSGSGVMFTTDDVLEVTVEIEEDGKTVRRTGRLSRVQRLNSDEIAVAIEFDDDGAQPDGRSAD